MGLQAAKDFREESKALYAVLGPLDPAEFDRATQFKGWSVNAVLQHLHFWNLMAGYQLTDEARLIDTLQQIFSGGGNMRAFEAEALGGLQGPKLLEAWNDGVNGTADTFSGADPKQRLKWAGPDMSARSSITARLMETWAHGQEVYDLLGVTRQNTDRIHNIVVLGVNTYGWTFKNRKLPVPKPMPYLVLTAPSGAIWTFGEAGMDERITGPAEAFCQVVTQTRNIADTTLEVTGPTATAWMSMAQCFAGAPATPPRPGTRGLETRPVSSTI